MACSRILLVVLFLVVTLVIISCQQEEPSFEPVSSSAQIGRIDSPVTDIDGNFYQTVRLDNQIWMAENLNVTHSPDAGLIESFVFRDDPDSYGKYGRLYTWETATNSGQGSVIQGICPDEWRIPSDRDWNQLVEYLGGMELAGKKLLPGQESGFDAFPSGGADFRGNYVYFGEEAMYWSSTETGPERANHWGTNPDGRLSVFAARKGARISVRCVKDLTTED